MEADSCLKNDYRRHPFYAFNAEPIQENYIKAKKLFEKEGNTEMVKECEEAIEDLKD